jgi:hypothetical protein
MGSFTTGGTKSRQIDRADMGVDLTEKDVTAAMPILSKCRSIEWTHG